MEVGRNGFVSAVGSGSSGVPSSPSTSHSRAASWLSGGMDLRVEVVERADLVPLGEQPVGEVRADEAGAAGDENAHGRGGGYLSSGARGEGVDSATPLEVVRALPARPSHPRA